MRHRSRYKITVSEYYTNGQKKSRDFNVSSDIELVNEKTQNQRFFFQAEDGIRDGTVTGVQTCALPISALAQRNLADSLRRVDRVDPVGRPHNRPRNLDLYLIGNACLRVGPVIRHREPAARGPRD